MTPERVKELRDISNMCTCGSHINACLDAIEALQRERDMYKEAVADYLDAGECCCRYAVDSETPDTVCFFCRIREALGGAK